MSDNIMTPRITKEHVEIQGRKFIINKLPAQSGGYYSYLLGCVMLPLGIENFLGLKGVLSTNRPPMEPQMFTMMMNDCLRMVEEELPGRNAPVMDSRNQFGVDGLSTNSPVTMMLMAHVLKLSLDGFFDGNLWRESGLLPQAIFELIPKT